MLHPDKHGYRIPDDKLRSNAADSHAAVDLGSALGSIAGPSVSHRRTYSAVAHHGLLVRADTSFSGARKPECCAATAPYTRRRSSGLLRGFYLVSGQLLLDFSHHALLRRNFRARFGRNSRAFLPLPGPLPCAFRSAGCCYSAPLWSYSSSVTYPFCLGCRRTRAVQNHRLSMGPARSRAGRQPVAHSPRSDR